MNRDDIVKLQSRLNAAGFQLKPDGLYGEKTAEAYRRYLRGLGPQDEPIDLPVPPPPKPWWKSTAIRGGLAQVMIGLGAIAGLSLDPTQVAHVLDAVAAIFGITSGQEVGGVMTYAAVLLSLLASLASLWGSAKRQAPIDTGLVLPGVRVDGGGGVPRGSAHELPPGGDGPTKSDPFDDPFISGGG